MKALVVPALLFNEFTGSNGIETMEELSFELWSGRSATRSKLDPKTPPISAGLFWTRDSRESLFVLYRGVPKTQADILVRPALSVRSAHRYSGDSHELVGMKMQETLFIRVGEARDIDWNEPGSTFVLATFERTRQLAMQAQFRFVWVKNEESELVPKRAIAL